MEHPADRGQQSEPLLYLHADHCPIWMLDYVIALATHCKAKTATLAQCMLGWGSSTFLQIFSEIYHVTMLQCYHVTMLPCYHVTMLPVTFLGITRCMGAQLLLDQSLLYYILFRIIGARHKPFFSGERWVRWSWRSPWLIPTLGGYVASVALFNLVEPINQALLPQLAYAQASSLVTLQLCNFVAA